MTYTPRHAVQVIEAEVFSHSGGKPRLADIYLPIGLEGRIPVVLWVHGGGWRFGDRKLCPDLSRFFAQHGFAMVSFDYRLSDEAIFPEPVVDVKTAIRWVRSIADRLSLDPERIALWVHPLVDTFPHVQRFPDQTSSVAPSTPSSAAQFALLWIAMVRRTFREWMQTDCPRSTELQTLKRGLQSQVF